MFVRELQLDGMGLLLVEDVSYVYSFLSVSYMEPFHVQTLRRRSHHLHEAKRAQK
jgi:hypothetical protein